MIETSARTLVRNLFCSAWRCEDLVTDRIVNECGEGMQAKLGQDSCSVRFDESEDSSAGQHKSSSREIFWTTSRSSAVRTGFPWKIMQSAAGKGQLLAHHEGPRQVPRFPHALEGRGL